jgi:hypothetical protein
VLWHLVLQLRESDTIVIDPQALALGVTEMVPVARKSRWTLEIGPSLVITPRHPRDQVAGEILIKQRS